MAGDVNKMFTIDIKAVKVKILIKEILSTQKNTPAW